MQKREEFPGIFRKRFSFQEVSYDKSLTYQTVPAAIRTRAVWISSFEGNGRRITNRHVTKVTEKGGLWLVCLGHSLQQGTTSCVRFISQYSKISEVFFTVRLYLTTSNRHECILGIFVCSHTSRINLTNYSKTSIPHSLCLPYFF